MNLSCFVKRMSFYNPISRVVSYPIFQYIVAATLYAVLVIVIINLVVFLTFLSFKTILFTLK